MDESIWHWLRDKLIPPLVVASFAFGGTTALTARNNSVLLAGLRTDTDKMERRFDHADNSRAAECAAVRARIAAIDARLGVIETRHESHLTEANEWKDRIRRCEASDGGVRHCVEVDERLRKLEDWRAIDEHRMGQIETRLKIGNP